ncbi:50S ribosomal protein L4 [Patescibacteria group bacterium]|nr:50S ribosomal protein L4 [Patescibacteria group bacterium]
MKLRVASTIGKDSTMTVADAIFSAPLNEQLIAQAVRVYLSNQRQATAKTKTRSEVARTKKKWFKQKGTGNARHGARTPSLFVGGGVAHGPTGTQNYNLKLSATMRQTALKSALSAQQERILVCDDLAQLDGKTSSAQKMLVKLLPEATSILIVLEKPSQMVKRSLRNLPNVFVTNPAQLTTFDVASSDAIVFTKDAVKVLETRLSETESTKN